uniref:Cytochrome c biogenesis protein CcsA n=1 Tax=Vaginularia trichoidea TaxID=474354 RepID=A0A3G5CTC5_9MONI|nr:cytochrome c heme attachment protein [Vaginularia trichoidea]AYW16123.1 cytochrome c heme attachment protein [Vaginularia trichoidea]
MMYTHIEYILVHISFLMLFFATLLSLINLFYQIEKLYRFNQNIMTVCFLCTTGFLVTRWFQAKHFPLSNLYESLLFLQWGFSLLYLTLYLKDKNGLARTVIAPSATLINVFASSSIPEQMQHSMILVPASHSYWLIMHVSTMLISYATSLCGSLLAIILLSLLFTELTSNPVRLLKTKYEKNFFISHSTIYTTNQKQINEQNSSYLFFVTVQKCQLVNYLDRWIYKTISLGFCFLTLGILSGSVWANEAWGSFWSWDPKETWALVTWLFYAIYLHTKFDERSSGELSAIAASTGFSSIWICFLGVNLLGVGLHNYGWLT